MFNQACYIHKCTYELIEKVHKLGYKEVVYWCIDAGDNYIACCRSGTVFTAKHNVMKQGDYGYINCGSNEELFLALAALRDDSDFMQWFTNGSKWCISEYSKGFYENGWRKATVEELIEHFKK